MTEKPRRPQGRPKAENPKATTINFRVDDEIVRGLERLREEMGILTFSLGDTVRELVVRTLKAKGLVE